METGFTDIDLRKTEKQGNESSEKQMQNTVFVFILFMNVCTTILHFYVCIIQSAAMDTGNINMKCVFYSQYVLSRFYISFVFWLVLVFILFLYISMQCHKKTRSLMYKSILLIHEATRQTVKINNQSKNCKIIILKCFEMILLGIASTYFASFLFLDSSVFMTMIETCDDTLLPTPWLRISLCLNISVNSLNLVVMWFVMMMFGLRCRGSNQTIVMSPSGN
jgi:hypothetical protein